MKTDFNAGDCLMAARDDSWVHRFVVSDPLKHAKGFTLYKVTSVVYPKRFPETATKVIVWKRYNDFKKLHKDLKSRHSKLHLGDKFPPFVKAKYFSRFEEEVIEERRRAALLLLEFIAKHASLYNSDIFVQFFEVGYTVIQEAGTGELRADDDTLQPTHRLPSSLDQQYDGGAYSLSSEDDVASYLTDTDSVVLPNQSNDRGNSIDEIRKDDKSSILNLVRNEPEQLHVDHSSGAQNVCSLQSKPAKQNENGISKRFWDLTSTKLRINAFTESNEKPEYCIVAEQYVEEAELKEAMKNYRAAFDLYKKAISCWLSGVQSDMNHNRRKMIKEKTSHYLLRAEFIANNYLTDDIPETTENELLPLSHLWRPVSQLGTYKVLNVIGKVMLVMDTNTHSLFVIKPLLKSVLPDDHSKKCILPRGGPYIVNLHAVFETDNAVYLVIQHISTGKLWDYIAPYFLRENDASVPTLNDSKEEMDEISYSCSIAEDTKEILTYNATDLTTNSSQSSLSSQGDTYLELLNNYTRTKLKENTLPQGSEKIDSDGINTENVNIGSVNDHSFECNICPKMIIAESFNSLKIDINDDNGLVESVINLNCNDCPSTNEQMLENSLNFLNNKQKYYENTHVGIHAGCNDILQIVTDSMTITENYDIETNTLVEKAQVLLKSVSETLSKSENMVSSMGSRDIEPLPKQSYCEEYSLNDNLNASHRPDTNLMKDNALQKSEYEIEGKLEKDLNILSVSSLNLSTCLPDYIRGLSPVSSGSDIGEVQWCEWGIEGKGLNMDVVVKWSSQLLVAINYLHLLGIIFRDLNPDNILVAGDGNLRLTYQCQFPGVEPVLDHKTVKTLYIAPECSGIHGISKAVDWWSYGVIMYNLITGRSLNYYHPGGIFEHSIIYVPDYIPEQAKSLLEQLLKFDSNQRLGSGASGVEEIKAHPFFKGINWEQVYKDGLPR